MSDVPQHVAVDRQHRARAVTRAWLVLACVSVAACGSKPTDRELVEAVEARDRERVNKLLAKGANPNAHDDVRWGRDVICLAARNEQPEMVAALLERGAQAGAGLSCAVGEGAGPVSRLLLAAGAKPDLTNAEEKELALATEACDMDVVDQLLAAGADVDGAAESGRGYPPITVAAGKGHAACVKRLLAAGAKLEHRDKLGITALASAVVGGNIDVVRMILAAGGDPLAPNRAGWTAAFTASYREDRAEILQLFRDAGVTDFAMKTPPSLPGGGPYIRVPAVQVQGR